MNKPEPSEDLGSVIASRVVEGTDPDGARYDIHVFIGKPVRSTKTRHDRFDCRIEIVGKGRRKQMKLGGSDSVQALLYALAIAPVRLRAMYGKELDLDWIGDPFPYGFCWPSSGKDA